MFRYTSAKMTGLGATGTWDQRSAAALAAACFAGLLGLMLLGAALLPPAAPATPASVEGLEAQARGVRREAVASGPSRRGPDGEVQPRARRARRGQRPSPGGAARPRARAGRARDGPGAARRAPRGHVQERRLQRARRALQPERPRRGGHAARLLPLHRRGGPGDGHPHRGHGGPDPGAATQTDADRAEALDKEMALREQQAAIEDELAARETLLRGPRRARQEAPGAAGAGSTRRRPRVWPGPPASTWPPSTARRRRSPWSGRR